MAIYLLKDDHKEHILGQALSEYPNECCGMIIGNIDNECDDQIFSCKNIQNKMHKKNPEIYTRTAQTAYLMNLEEVQNIEKEASSKNQSIKWIYHSHCDHDAYFSETDRQAALPFGDELIYPSVNFLVISIKNDHYHESNAFVWNPISKDFDLFKSPIQF